MTTNIQDQRKTQKLRIAKIWRIGLMLLLLLAVVANPFIMMYIATTKEFNLRKDFVAALGTSSHMMDRIENTTTIRTISLYNEPYPVAASKKGLVVEMMDDALTLGVKHVTLNLNLSQLIDPHGDTINTVWDFLGSTYRFKLSYVEEMDHQIKWYSDQGVLVNIVVLAYASNDAEVNRIVLHPRYNPIDHKNAQLSAFNTVTDDGQLWFVASMEFMTERWSRPDQSKGRIVGFIMGNEVNTHWWWSNMGKVSMEEFADDYLRSVRLAHKAIRKHSSWCRVYISLEHHWNIRYPAGDEQQSFAGRSFLDYFARRSMEWGDFDWHLSFHPYPRSLQHVKFWKDKSLTNDDNTPLITFKNLPVLMKYLRQPRLLFEGKTRRVILSEQGFHTSNKKNGEKQQAAAYCYAYKIVESLDGIDSFIYHRHVDHPDEGGLLLGLRAFIPSNGEDRPKKKIYNVFQLVDTPKWKKACKFALPVIGLKSWSTERYGIKIVQLDNRTRV